MENLKRLSRINRAVVNQGSRLMSLFRTSAASTSGLHRGVFVFLLQQQFPCHTWRCLNHNLALSSPDSCLPGDTSDHLSVRAARSALCYSHRKTWWDFQSHKRPMSGWWALGYLLPDVSLFFIPRSSSSTPLLFAVTGRQLSPLQPSGPSSVHSSWLVIYGFLQ